jgi:magnesium and cobalt transporter
MTQTIPEEPKSWLEKLAAALLREPQDRTHLIQIIRDASERNLLDPETLGMVEGVIRYSELRVRDIMLPRAQIIAIDSDSNYETVLEIIRNHGHSRYPVYTDSLDNLIGILHVKELLLLPPDQGKFELSDLLRPTAIVPESKHLNVLLTEFRRQKNHMAIVVDEYGSISGFITIEDVIEQIVGDIEDEFDNNEDAFINQHPDGKYIIKAQISIEELNEYFNLQLQDDNYETLAGLLLKATDHMPAIGETIKINNLQFKILNADSRRIKLVEFTLKEKP